MRATVRQRASLAVVRILTSGSIMCYCRCQCVLLCGLCVREGEDKCRLGRWRVAFPGPQVWARSAPSPHLRMRLRRAEYCGKQCSGHRRAQPSVSCCQRGYRRCTIAVSPPRLPLAPELASSCPRHPQSPPAACERGLERHSTQPACEWHAQKRETCIETVA